MTINVLRDRPTVVQLVSESGIGFSVTCYTADGILAIVEKAGPTDRVFIRPNQVAPLQRW